MIFNTIQNSQKIYDTFLGYPLQNRFLNKGLKYTNTAK